MKKQIEKEYSCHDFREAIKGKKGLELLGVVNSKEASGHIANCLECQELILGPLQQEEK